MKVKYVGPFDEVEIADTGLVCKQGDTVEVDDDLAEGLLEQESNWQSVKSTGKSTGKAGDKE